MIDDLIEKVVADQWRAGMGANTLFQKVQEILKNEDVEVTKQKVKAAKLIIPYSMQDSSNEGNSTLSVDKIKFISQKINERQRCRQGRKFKDADYIERGLVKMGVVMNDANKTWSLKNQGCKEDNSELFEKLDSLNINKIETKDTAGMVRCEMCGKLFKSRNLMFKHLRDPGSDCGNTIFANDQSLPVAPSIKKKIEKKKVANSAVIRSRARTGKTAQHASSTSTVWFGDLPLHWTRVGGQYKKLRALLRQYLPRDVPQPWIKLVIRKAYRKRSICKDISPDEERVKNEYLGYAIVVFRCDEEAKLVRKSLDGKQVCPKHVFQQTGDTDNLNLPEFILKVRAADNGDSIKPIRQQTGQDPPLIETLRPLTVEELEKRIAHLKKIIYYKDIQFNEEKELSDKDGILNKMHPQQIALAQAVQLYNALGPRIEKRSEGKQVPEHLTRPLLKILSSMRWKVPNERGHLNAERYLVLPTNVSKDIFYGELRDACRDLMQWADSSYFYSGIAVTKNFVSSPHIDDRDQSFQYAISLGDFEGGELCVEGRNLNKETKVFEDYVNVVNTRNRIARVDGRNIHWVRGFSGGDRYSLIFYDTTSRFQTPIVESGVCLQFLDDNT